MLEIAGLSEAAFREIRVEKRAQDAPAGCDKGPAHRTKHAG